jgi:hypothetical protein
MTMSSNELLLGFDAREMWLDVTEYWPEERKRHFLLRQDIVKPLSTDTLVWRSVFDVEQTPNRPQWTGPIQELWEDLATLHAYLDTAWSERTLPSWIIAVTLQEVGCKGEVCWSGTSGYRRASTRLCQACCLLVANYWSGTPEHRGSSQRFVIQHGHCWDTMSPTSGC